MPMKTWFRKVPWVVVDTGSVVAVKTLLTLAMSRKIFLNARISACRSPPTSR
jgi:hypothetical protein